MIIPPFYANQSKDNRYILVCCFFVFAVNGLYAMILGPLLPLISGEYGLSNTISGALLSAHQTGNLISGFIAGLLPLYLGRKKSVIMLCSFVILGFLIMISTGNPLLLLLAFLFTGLSRGSISNFNNAVVNEISGSDHGALSFLHSVFAVGALASPFLVMLTTNLFGDEGWRISAAVIIVLAFTSIFLFSGMKISDGFKRKKHSGISCEFLKNPRFLSCAGVFFFYLCIEAAVSGWIIKYFLDKEIMTKQYAQMLASLLWLTVLAGRLFCAYKATAFHQRTLLLILGLGTTAFYILLLATQSPVVITVSIAGLGLFMAGIYPTAVSRIGDIINSYPMAMGVFLIIGGIGAILMPIITGVLADAAGIFAGMTSIALAAILMLVCIVISNKIPDQRQ